VWEPVRLAEELVLAQSELVVYRCRLQGGGWKKAGHSRRTPVLVFLGCAGWGSAAACLFLLLLLLAAPAVIDWGAGFGGAGSSWRCAGGRVQQ
jgi:hypothetical protein